MSPGLLALVPDAALLRALPAWAPASRPAAGSLMAVPEPDILPPAGRPVPRGMPVMSVSLPAEDARILPPSEIRRPSARDPPGPYPVMPFSPEDAIL